MKSLIVAAKQFAQDEEGVTAIEYGLVAATIASIVIAAFALLGGDLKSGFEKIGKKIAASIPE